MTGMLQRIGRIKLHNQILIGLVLGAVLGPLMGRFALEIKPVGDAFINLLIMVVVPLVMASLIVGTASLGDLRKLGRIGLKTVAHSIWPTPPRGTIRKTCSDKGTPLGG